MSEPKPLKKKIYSFALGACIVLAAIYALSPDEELTPAEKRKQKIEAQFSPLNGEHKNLTKLIKQSMNDPKSYENIQTNYWDMDTAIIVNQEYTGTNALGGRVRGFIKASIDTNGNVISILESR